MHTGASTGSLKTVGSGGISAAYRVAFSAACIASVRRRPSSGCVFERGAIELAAD